MMNIQKDKKTLQCWIGLAHVRPKEDNNLLEGAIGAFVPTIALAGSFDTFVSIMTKELESYDFEVIEIEDIKPFKDRLNNSDVDDEIKVLAEGLSDKYPIAFDVFQAYVSVHEVGEVALKSADDVISSFVKSVDDMALDLSNKINKNSVKFTTPTTSVHIDLKGAAHFDKPTQTLIPTPYVQTKTVNVSPDGWHVTYPNKTLVTRKATKQDIRLQKKIIEKRKDL